jgi:hypothetical protein
MLREQDLVRILAQWSPRGLITEHHARHLNLKGLRLGCSILISGVGGQVVESAQSIRLDYK